MFCWGSVEGTQLLIVTITWTFECFIAFFEGCLIKKTFFLCYLGIYKFFLSYHSSSSSAVTGLLSKYLHVFCFCLLWCFWRSVFISIILLDLFVDMYCFFNDHSYILTCFIFHLLVAGPNSKSFQINIFINSNFLN